MYLITDYPRPRAPPANSIARNWRSRRAAAALAGSSPRGNELFFRSGPTRAGLSSATQITVVVNCLAELRQRLP